MRAYELRSPEGGQLPEVQAGSHIHVPVRLESGVTSTRRYSISSNPGRPDSYEIPALREDAGSGGSAAVHAKYELGMLLRIRLPGNDFPLHDDERPAVLIAGGIGITPIKAMAHKLSDDGRPFELHYTARSRAEAAYSDDLDYTLGARLHLYAADRQQRLDVPRLMAHAAVDAEFYVCGPAQLIDVVRKEAMVLGFADERVRFERFVAAPSGFSIERSR